MSTYIKDFILASIIILCVGVAAISIPMIVQADALDKQAAIILDNRVCRNEHGHRVVCQQSPCRYYPPVRTIPISRMLKEN